MKITDIDWDIGKRYEDNDGNEWEVRESCSGKLSLYFRNDPFQDEINAIYSLQEICAMEFEAGEKKYCLRLDKPYCVKTSLKYLNFNRKDEEIFLASCQNNEEYRTEFTEEEIIDLECRFGNCIADFTKIPVEELDG